MDRVPFTYTPDPDAVMEEVSKLRKKAAEETAQAEEALLYGHRNKAALCYFSAFEALDEASNLEPSDENRLELAQCSWELSGFADVGIEELAGHGLRSRAGMIWLELYERTRLSRYREKAAMAGEILPDYTDYTRDINYLDRSISELADLAVVLENYDVLVNDDGDIMLTIHKVPQGDETGAILFCDGGEHAILFKGPYRLIVCDFLHPQVQKKLFRLKEVICYEDQNPNLDKCQYMATVVKFSGTTALATRLLQRR